MGQYHQDGQILLRSGVFYIRYNKDGKRVAEPLRHPDNSRVIQDDQKHRTVTSKAVVEIARKHMEPINAATEKNPESPKIASFYTETYLPWATGVKQLRASTLAGYEKVWDLYLVDHFGKRSLAEYRVSDGSGLLTQLAQRGLRRASLGHVRALASAIFTHAVNLGMLSVNPWRDVKCLAKINDNDPTKAYTIDEARAIWNALATRVDAQCVFGMSFFCGLRPSETAALTWSDVKVDHDIAHVHVHQAAPSGAPVAGTKTGRDRRVPLIEPLRSRLEVWRLKCGSPDAGYIFPRANGGPLNVESMVVHSIKPLLEAAGIAWNGLYSARRAHGVWMTRIASLTAARATLGHGDELTTARYYALTDPIAAATGMKLLEADWENIGPVSEN